jgi:hypothetical protein
MATYVNNLRLEEITTGDASGTWGTKTNTNLELIGKALGYATEASFGSDANATTTVADGADDPARALYFKVTSGATLSATRELTIAPNTISRVMIIENATTGSQIITIKQGSGATVNIPSGGVKAVYLDGAGAGAAVVDALADLDLTGTTTAATVTASGVITGATVEATGDTSAGDNAAVGYTSAEGLILTGQGSTNDVTIKNDADADVLEIPTGTTNVDIVGVATAATFEPDGDTAAGDNAAIGYTSAEGLILTGQGSTNDVTVKNDADGDVIAIPTGGTDANFHGNVNILAQGDLRLQDSSGGEYAAIQAPATIGSSYTLTLPADDGDADQILSTNGSGVLDWATNTYLGFEILTANKSMEASGQYVSNSSSTLTHTLPSGSAGATIVLSNVGSGAVTVARTSSQKIDSAAEDGTLNQGASVQFVYVDSTVGWHTL